MADDEQVSEKAYTQAELDRIVADQLSGLKAKADELLSETKRAKQQLKDFEGFNPAEFKKLKEAAAKLKK